MGYKISCSKGAEVSRMILAHAGISYEDYRVPQEDWPAMKPSKYQFQNTVFSSLKYRYLIIVYLLLKIRVSGEKKSILIKFFHQ